VVTEPPMAGNQMTRAIKLSGLFADFVKPYKSEPVFRTAKLEHFFFCTGKWRNNCSIERTGKCNRECPGTFILWEI